MDRASGTRPVSILHSGFGHNALNFHGRMPRLRFDRMSSSESPLTIHWASRSPVTCSSGMEIPSFFSILKVAGIQILHVWRSSVTWEASIEGFRGTVFVLWSARHERVSGIGCAILFQYKIAGRSMRRDYHFLNIHQMFIKRLRKKLLKMAA